MRCHIEDCYAKARYIVVNPHRGIDEQLENGFVYCVKHVMEVFKLDSAMFSDKGVEMYHVELCFPKERDSNEPSTSLS